MRLSEKEAEELIKNINKKKGQKLTSKTPKKVSTESPKRPDEKLIEVINNEIKIIIPIPPVTKKNHGNIIHYGRKCPTCKRGLSVCLIPSDAYNNYKKDIAPYISFIASQLEVIDSPVNLKCLFYLNKKSQSDLVGFLQSIQDLLVDGGVLEDDNRNIVASTDGSRVFYDKDYPRTEIYISKVENYEQWGKNKKKAASDT